MKLKFLLPIIYILSGNALADDCPDGRLFKHESGQTCVATSPKRIIALEYAFLDALSVLDIKPIAYTKDLMPRYLNDFTQGLPTIGKRKMPSLETMVELKPDLILADKRLHENQYKALSAIAPTILRNTMRGSVGDQIATLRQIAKMTDSEAKAETAIAKLREQLQKARQTSTPETTALLVFRAGSMSAHGKDSFIGSLAEQLGKTSALQTRGTQRQYYLDLEGLAAINPDSLVLMCSPDAQQALDDMLKNPLFKALKAVKNKRLYTVPKTQWAKGRGLNGIKHIVQDAQNSGWLSGEKNEDLICKP